MKSFIIALLPGLEEETGEYFEKVLLHQAFEGSLAQLHVSGAWNPRSLIRNSVPVIFPAKRLVDHVDEPI